MNLEETDPDFDRALELLCVLPMAPLRVKVDGVMNSLGINDEGLGVLCAQLRARGIHLDRTYKDDHAYGNTLALHPETWQKALKIGQNYWRRVYGE